MISVLLRLLRRFRRNQPARVILIDELGHRMEYVHEGDDPIFWQRVGVDEVCGFRALGDLAETFIHARAPKGSA